MRYLTPSDEVPPASELEELFADGWLDCSLHVSRRDGESWERLDLVGPENKWFAVEVHRHAVQYGEADIEDMLGNPKKARPACNVCWLRSYLPQVRTGYYLRLHGGHEYWSKPVYELRDYLEEVHPLILWAEFEGWSNEEGEHITWEFTPRVSGPWWMGLLIDGRWHRFRMELGNKVHRDCFTSGIVPPGLEVQTRPA
jgi:hypothetical protein